MKGFKLSFFKSTITKTKTLKVHEKNDKNLKYRDQNGRFESAKN